MPTVPDFSNRTSAQKKAWLQEWFESKGDLDCRLHSWSITVKRCDSAITYAGYTAATIVAALAVIQTVVLSTSNSSDSSAKTFLNILTYLQAGLGTIITLIGLICKIIKETHATPLRELEIVFSDAFFNEAEMSAAVIWPEAQSPPLARPAQAPALQPSYWRTWILS